MDPDILAVEQDMYPVAFDKPKPKPKPKPIAERTYRYLRSVGVGEPS